MQRDNILPTLKINHKQKQMFRKKNDSRANHKVFEQVCLSTTRNQYTATLSIPTEDV